MSVCWYSVVDLKEVRASTHCIIGKKKICVHYYCYKDSSTEIEYQYSNSNGNVNIPDGNFAFSTESKIELIPLIPIKIKQFEH